MPMKAAVLRVLCLQYSFDKIQIAEMYLI